MRRSGIPGIVRRVSTEPDLTTPLEGDELEALDEQLEGQTPLGLSGVLGILHAVAIAPSSLAQSEWMRLIEFDGAVHSADDMRVLLPQLLRLHHQVVDLIERDLTLLPQPEDVDAFASFAAGFVLAAQLDSLWKDDAHNWSYVAPFALLAGRPELVEPELRASMETEAGYLADLRKDAENVILDARDFFHEPPKPEVPAKGAAKVGRNDPCTCGSGKKYKKCCGAV